MHTYFAHRYFDGQQLLHNVRFCVEQGVITEITVNTDAADAVTLDGLIVPAFIDIQVNGGGGVQFNEQPTLACLKQMADAHFTTGTGAMMPTLITDDITVMTAGAEAIAQAVQQMPDRILGVHFEGPHLSTAKKGMHSASHIRQLSAQELAIFTRKDLGNVVVTVAPETVSPNDIRLLVEQGVTVSLGHSNASAEQCALAFNAGATAATHLYNAMSPLTSREPGLVGSALMASDVYCGLIVDLAHVHPLSATLAIKLKGPSKIMLITDAMAPAASESDHFYYQGIKVTRRDNTLRLADGTLAGSVLTMEQAVQHCHFDLQIPIADTLKMATSTPASWIGVDARLGGLGVGQYATMLALDEDLHITDRWHKGQLL